MKRLPSIGSADQYLVSSPQTTEVSTTSSYPLLLKYHNLEDSAYFNSTAYSLEPHPSNSLADETIQNNEIFLVYPHINGYSDLTDINTSELYQDMTQKVSFAEYGLVGLHNLENSCFMNSIIQCLRFTKPILEYMLLRREFQNEVNGSNPRVVHEFINLVQKLWSLASERAVSPRAFSEAVQSIAPEFNGFTQEDAHEFLLCILTALHENLNRSTIKHPEKLNSTDALQSHTMWRNYQRCNDSYIIDFFVGQLRSTITCTHCGNISATFDPFWDLSLPIPSYADTTTTIHDCLRACLNEERIDGANMPFCNRCKTHQACRKQMSVHRLPRILTLHLKRFTEDQEKLDTMVTFPLQSLDISAYCTSAVASGSATYKLYGVVNHKGSMTYGHYTAFCHHPFSNEWFEFNDHHVLHLECDDCIITDKAYILFYELVGQSSKL